MTENDTCRRLVVPLSQTARWDNVLHSITEQRYATDGRIVSLDFDSLPDKERQFTNSQTLPAWARYHYEC